VTYKECTWKSLHFGQCDNAIVNIMLEKETLQAMKSLMLGNRAHTGHWLKLLMNSLKLRQWSICYLGITGMSQYR
jgi:hypothetical protein